MISKVSECLKFVSSYLPAITQCYINRIDYCVNLQLKHREHVINYIRLFKKCILPKKFMIKRYYEKKDKAFSQDGVTLKRGKLLKITVYNKERQMKKENFKYPSGNAPNGLLRLEIQCFYRKVKGLQKKFNTVNIIDFLNFSDKISYEVFNHYIPKLLGRGDFYTLERAIQIIEDLNYRRKEKDKMIELVNHSAFHKNLNIGIQKLLRDGCKEDVIKRLMKKFDDCNLSPM